MRKLLPPLITLICFQHFALAQSSRIDSLKIQLTRDTDDTVKINHLNELAWELLNVSPDSASLLSSQALQLAEMQRFDRGIANSYYLLAAGRYFNGDFVIGLENAKKALSIYERLQDKMGQSKSLRLTGLIYKEQSDFINALDFQSKALQIDQELGDKGAIGSDLSNLGIVYISQGDYTKALDYYFKALRIAEKIGNKNLIANNLTNIGMAYDVHADYEKALEYHFKALTINEELGNKFKMATILGNIGLAYQNQRNYSSASDYYLRALKLSEELGDKNSMGRHSGNIASLYYDQNDYSNALIYYTKALKLVTETGDKLASSVWQGNIGRLYIKTGEFKKAEDELTQSIAVLDSLGSIDYLRQFEENLSQLYDTMGNYHLALVHYKKAMVLKDSLFNQEKNKEITRKELNYEFDKKEALAKAEQEKKDAVAQKELQKQKLVRNGFVAGFAIVLLFAGVFFSQRNKINKEKKRSDNLLLNILPAEVAEELKEKGNAKAKQFDEVTVMFTDFKNFTQFTEKLSPSELVREIDYYFKAFDSIISKHNIEKIKTIGDSYMCAGGLPVANKTNATDVVMAALEIQKFMSERLNKSADETMEPFEMRIGIHTGPVIAGIVGIKKFAYDIWGDTVNVASRMESTCEAGKVNISGTTYEQVKDKFNCFYRGKVQAKNKGGIDMYFVESIPDKLS